MQYLRRLISGLLVFFLVGAGLLPIPQANVVKAYENIYIRADGSIDPPTAPIHSADNMTYTFIENISGSIAVQRNSIVLDGAGYVLIGSGVGRGVDLSIRYNVTLKSIMIRGFERGVYLDQSSHVNVSRIELMDNRMYDIYAWNSSHNVIAENSFTSSYAGGLVLDMWCDDNTVIRNNFTSTRGDNAIDILESSNNKIAENNIVQWGIRLRYCSNDTLSSNNLTVSDHGILIEECSRTILINNTVTGLAEGNYCFGIELYRSSNVSLIGNVMQGKGHHFGVGGDLIHFMNSIPTSNLVDGKPIYYLTNQRNVVMCPEYYPEIGYLALINCTNMIIERLNLQHNKQGLVLVHTNGSMIVANSIANNIHGIYLQYSFNNTVIGNAMAMNIFSGFFLVSSKYNTLVENCVEDARSAICLYRSSNNVMTRNSLAAGGIGIEALYCSNDTILENNVRANHYGLWLWRTSGSVIVGNVLSSNFCGIDLSNGGQTHHNKIHHNNFVNNTSNHIRNANTSWDDGVEGNYWSDYGGADLDHDGIGDTPYQVGSVSDNFPLMGRFSSVNTTLGEKVNIVSNSTVDDFEYFQSNKTIRLHVSNTTADQTFGFVRICIPHTLMNESYRVLVDGADPYYVNYTVRDNGTHRWIYFNYQHSIRDIVIIRELSHALIMPVLTAAALLTVLVRKARRWPKDKL